MPEFILDTSGEIINEDSTLPTRWPELDAFTQGYIEALFFTNCDPSAHMAEIESDHEFTDGSIPADAGFGDLQPESLAKIIADCARFQSENAEDLACAYELEPGRYNRHGNTIDARRAGQFFWYASAGHGIGWDDDFEPGMECLERLQEASRKFGGRDVVWSAPFVFAE